MTVWFVAVAYLAAVNPLRIRPQMTADEQPGDPGRLGVAAATVASAGLLLAIGANTILDALDITDETWRLAAGAVCILAGARDSVASPLAAVRAEDESALVPVAFPLLFTPQLAALAILFGATESVPTAWGWLVLAVGAGAAAGLLRYRRTALWLGLARLPAATLVVVGVALVIAGIRDV